MTTERSLREVAMIYDGHLDLSTASTTEFRDQPYQRLKKKSIRDARSERENEPSVSRLSVRLN